MYYVTYVTAEDRRNLDSAWIDGGRSRTVSQGLGNTIMITLVNTLAGTELDRVCGGRGAEMNMIELQSLVAKRGVVLQMATGMLSAVNQATNSIIKNIR